MFGYGYCKRAAITIGVGVLGAFLAVAAPARAAEDFPSQTIRIIVGYEPGAIVDFAARQIASRLSEALDTSVIVENRAGAGGHLAAAYVAQAAPDGYTLLFHDSGTVTAPALGQKLEYDAKTDLEPIAIAASGAFFLYGNPGNAANTIDEVVAELKANPNKYFYGSSGVGALNHIAFAMFLQEIGAEAKNVPYKGSGPVKVDILANRIQFSMSSAPGILSEYKAGQLKIFAYGGEKRSELLPDIPTLSETVAPGFTAGNWFGFAAPAGTDDAIADRLSQAIVAVMQDPELVEALKSQGAEPMALGRPEAEAFLAAEGERWAGVIQKAGITLK